MILGLKEIKIMDPKFHVTFGIQFFPTITLISNQIPSKPKNGLKEKKKKIKTQLVSYIFCFVLRLQLLSVSDHRGLLRSSLCHTHRSTKMEGSQGTVFAAALEGIKNVKSEQGEILSQPFLDVCKHILPVIDKFGAAMALVKADIGGNISRLESKYSSNPSRFNYLYSLVQTEVESKTAKSSSSCTNGLLWLTRAMDFLVALFRNLIEHEDWSMSQACTDSYNKTLKKWHGWLASSSFTIAMKLAPDRKKFMEVIAGSGDITADIEKFCTEFSPLLEENHKFLARFGLDDMKAS